MTYLAQNFSIATNRKTADEKKVTKEPYSRKKETQPAHL